MNTFAKAVGLVATGALILAAPASADEGQILRENAANAIPGSYVVVLDDAAVAGRPTDEIAALSEQYGADVEHQYANTVQGFSAEMTREAALALSTDPAVKYVEQDRVFKALATQTPPTWGLDRIDQRDLPLEQQVTRTRTAPARASPRTSSTPASAPPTASSGGRAVWGTNTTGDGQNTDCNGHGTHVAGTVGGKTYGVAKSVKLVAVKVLNCAGSGTFAGVIAGIDWVTGHHTSGAGRREHEPRRAGADAATESAIRNSIADGITYAIAAGNSNANACNFTPARVAEAITVNATTNTDARASFSNYGTCTDIFAPGQNITSAWNTERHRHQHHQRHVDGRPARGRRRRARPRRDPERHPAQVGATLISHRHAEHGHRPRHRLAEPCCSTPAAAPTPRPPPSLRQDQRHGRRPSPDNTTVFSDITIAGCNRNASATAKVDRGHRAHLQAATWSSSWSRRTARVYVLHNRAGGSADNIQQTFTVNLSSEPANGTWTLRVRDAASADTGSINSWTLEP